MYRARQMVIVPPSVTRRGTPLAGAGSLIAFVSSNGTGVAVGERWSGVSRQLDWWGRVILLSAASTSPSPGGWSPARSRQGPTVQLLGLPDLGGSR